MADKKQSSTSEQIQAILAQLQTTPAATQQRPIGVPAGYTVQRGTPTPDLGSIRPVSDRPGFAPTGVTQVPPRYFEGMDYEPAAQSPEAIAAL